MIYCSHQLTTALCKKPLWAFNYGCHEAPMKGHVKGRFFHYDGIAGCRVAVEDRMYAETREEAVRAYNGQVSRRIINLKSEIKLVEKDYLPEDGVTQKEKLP